MSNLCGVANGFVYQPFRFRWPAGLEWRRKESYRDIGQRPDIARLFKDPGRFSGSRFTEIQLTGVVASIHFLLGDKTNDAGGQLIFGTLVQFIEKLKSSIDFTNRSASISFERQQGASDGSRGILGVSSGAIHDLPRVLELPGP